MKIGKLGIIIILLLMICNSVGAVWIHPDVDIIVEDFTLNTVTAQNFTYVEIGTTYTNLSWDGTTYHNITFVTNVSSNESVIHKSAGYSLNQTTNISFNLYAPSDYTTSVTLDVITNAGVTDASVTPTVRQFNTTHKFCYYHYNPSDTIPDAGLGYFDVNITATVINATLTYTGYNLTEDLFYVFLVEPPYNGTSFYNTTLNGVNLTWQNGNNSEYTIVVQNNNSYPTSHSDGWVRSNSSSFTTYNDSSVYSTRYYTIFNYNTTYNMYSNGLDIPWGALGLSCYNESNPSQAIGFDIEITNSDASITYTASDLTNTHYIDLNDIPFGTNTIFVVSNSSYHQRIYYYNLVLNNFSNYTFYLPPITTEGGENGEGTLRTYTDVKSVINSSNDITITLTHTLEEMIGVYVYNISGTYPDWVSVPNDNYTISGNDVIINQSVLDDNTTMAKVDYWYMDYDNEVETQLYYIQVINEYDQPVKDATVNIKKYINTTDTYLPVSVLLTDGNGYVSLYLIPDEHYKIFVTKTGYDDEISDFFPAVLYYGIHYPKIVKIYLSEPGTDTLWTNIDWDISPTLYDHNNSISFYFNITSSDNKLEWYKMTVHYYNNSTGNWDLLYSFNKTISSGGGSITYTTPSTVGKYALYCSFKKEGYDSFHFGLPDCYVYHIWNISGGGGTDIDAIITNIAGDSPVYVGDTIIAYTSLIAAAVITFFLFTFSPKFAGFSIIVMGIIIGALKEPLHIITDDTINALAVTTIVILGIIVVLYTRKKG